ncbi:hypothetical protein BO78DRAFT_422947 [Aspergillus sclerotiicarbonarius CBS 121057]|uniref:Uncharacterized protein n=1 Tax=Aspergillus sclerotiicarbonarius (strain CBS 121057 / IBT 28362) TaxID=1448318 RepID=A0A319EMP7_ASPSB|nr:hypothetical protein BO78DRAFT_422947 [Aspergillus sclerotiicarbonarius CBS 121057]
MLAGCHRGMVQPPLSVGLASSAERLQVRDVGLGLRQLRDRQPQREFISPSIVVAVAGICKIDNAAIDAAEAVASSSRRTLLFLCSCLLFRGPHFTLAAAAISPSSFHYSTVIAIRDPSSALGELSLKIMQPVGRTGVRGLAGGPGTRGPNGKSP